MRLNMEGYDVVALCACDHGHIMVLNNNSDHFIVVDTESEGSLTVETINERLAPLHINPQASIRKTISYGPGRDHDYMTNAMASALAEMTRVALSFTSDPEDDDEAEPVHNGPEVINIEEYDRRWTRIMSAVAEGSMTTDDARTQLNALFATRRA